MRILENLYLYQWTDQRENNCNTVVVDGKVPLLIDPGHLRHVERLRSLIKADGLDPDSIRAVICTHAHPDHFESTLTFRKPGVRIGLAHEEEDFLEKVGRRMYMEHGLNMPDFRVDFYVGDGSLTIGKHEMQVLLTPGHSPGSICLYWPKERVLIAGDVVFMRGVGRVDLPGGDRNSLKQSIQRLSELPVELLLPGHGPAVQGREMVDHNYQFIKTAILPSL